LPWHSLRGQPHDGQRGALQPLQQVAEPVDVAVIIVNWRNEPETLRCAEAVRGWSTLKPELIVVDNESTIASRKALAGGLDPHCLVLSETNLGYGGGNNLGIKQALSGRAEYFLLLNSDAAISEAAVTGLLTRGWKPMPPSRFSVPSSTSDSLEACSA
jgi:glycosyl transferase family 2